MTRWYLKLCCLLRQYPFFLAVYLSIHPSIHPSIRPSIHPSNRFVCMYISRSVCLSVFQWSTRYCLSDFILSRLLRLQMLNFSASSPSQLPFPTLLRVVLVVVFLPVTRSFFAWVIFYPPCVLLVHNIST